MHLLQLLTLILLTTFSTPQASQRQPEKSPMNRIQMGLKGPVKLIKVLPCDEIKSEDEHIEVNRTLGLIMERPYSYSFDRFGRIIKYVYDAYAEIPLATTDYIYNSKGQLTKEIGGGVSNTETTYKYDLKGREIEKETYNEGMFQEKVVYMYNQAGNEVTELHYDEGGKVTSKESFLYPPKLGYTDGLNHREGVKQEFDKQGNWIKTLVYEEGELQLILLRRIEYYK